MVGKWHLCPTDEMNLASTRRNWPTGRGFERFYGFLGAETNQWYPDLVYDNHPVDQPQSPEEGYHLTDDLTDKALEFIKDAKAIAPDKPFFLYYAPGAATRRTTSPRSGSTSSRAASTWATRRSASRPWPGRRSWGSSRPTPSCRRSTRSARPRPAQGPARPAVPAARLHPAVGLAVRRREAAVLPDGRGVRRVPGPRRPPHRPAARLPGGDRAAGQHARDRGVRQRRQRRGRPERLGQRDEVRQRHPRRHAGEPGDDRRAGRPEDLQPLPERLGDGVQHAVQDVEAVRVQRRHRRPVHHLLARRRRSARGEIRAPVPPRDRHRADDPGRARRRGPGHDQGPRAEPRSTASACATASTTRPRRRRARPSSTRCSAPAAIWHDGWKAVTTHPTLSGWGHFNDDTWELYHTDTDRSELHNLAAEHPDKLRELVNLWYAEAGANGAFPLDDRSALEIITTPRPQLTAPRDRYVYFPGTAEVPESQAVNIRNRSYAIGALVDIPAPGAEGVLFAHGSRFGGHALYVKDNRLHYVYNFVGMMEQKIVGTEDIPTGENLILSASFDKDGEDPPGVATGILSLYHGDTKVGEGRIKTQPGQVRHRRRGPVRRPGQRRAGHRRLPGRVTRTASPAARSTGSRSTSAASPTSTSSARPPPCWPGSDLRQQRSACGQACRRDDGWWPLRKLLGCLRRNPSA